MFRGNKAQYNALFFRCEKGLIQLYKHGEKGNAYSYWSTATSIKTISNGFKKDNHHVEVVLKDNYLIKMIMKYILIFYKIVFFIVKKDQLVF